MADEQVTRVVNVRAEQCDVYVGRPSQWGNPFVIGEHGDRAEVIEMYRVWIMAKPSLLSQVGTLRGERLGCYCAPEACHGDVLVELADDHHVHDMPGFKTFVGLRMMCPWCPGDKSLKVEVELA